MVRSLLVVSLIVSSILSLSCSSYTNTLTQSSGRVDETVTISTLRSVARAQIAYREANGEYGTFEQLNTGGYLDSRFATNKPTLYGYTLNMTVTPRSGSAEPSYSCTAGPSETATTKGRHFYMDMSGAIHVNPTQPATENDETIQQ